MEAFFRTTPETVSVQLPDQKGEVSVPVQRIHVMETGMGCKRIEALVMKEAGDDPDVTHHARIGARVAIEKSDQNRVVIEGGEGVGTVTRAGLPVPKGEPAINPVPRKMIIHEVLRRLPKAETFTVTTEIFVEKGEEIAQKTLNPRLGIVGGISILGTSGIVKPFSAESYRETIDICLRSARSENLKKCVLSTGRRSERVAQAHFSEWPDLCFVQFADFFSYALQRVSHMGFEHVVLSGFFGKLCKWAMNMKYTHARSGLIDFDAMAQIARKAGCGIDFCRQVKNANNAREIFERPDAQLPLFVDTVGRLALENATGFSGHKPNITICLWDFEEKLFQTWDTQE